MRDFFFLSSSRHIVLCKLYILMCNATGRKKKKEVSNEACEKFANFSNQIAIIFITTF